MRHSTALFALAATLAACGASTELAGQSPARTCTDAPPGASLTPTRTPMGATLHWEMRGGCIATSYDPALAGALAEITAALDAWRNPCTDLCFSAPVASSTPPGIGERRVHFTRTPPQGFPSVPGMSSVAVLTFENTSGRVRNAQVVLLPDAPAERTRALLVRSVGQALGFASAAAGADSALAPDSGRAAPTASDVASLCAFYGRPPWCERP